MQICDNKPIKSFTSKINKHTAFGYSLFTHYSFDFSKSNHEYYRDENYMKNFVKTQEVMKQKQLTVKN